MPIHPELRALDEELAPFGGAARAIMDDAYAIGPPEVVFPALERGNEARRYSLRRPLIPVPAHRRRVLKVSRSETVGACVMYVTSVGGYNPILGRWGLRFFIHTHRMGVPFQNNVRASCLSAISYLPALATARFYNYI